MLTLTNSRLRLLWCVLTGTITTALLIPGATLHDPHLSAYVNSDWVHFLAYTTVSAVATLAWKFRTAFGICIGIAFTSIGLQIVRGIVMGKGLDVDGAVINLLGIAAGVLLALHIRRSGKFAKQLIAASEKSAHSSSSRSESVDQAPTGRSEELVPQTPTAVATNSHSRRFALGVTDQTVKE
jgi:hypothetical protein